MSLQASNAMGVKVEPKFLRDPSALESISSALYGLSSYVAHNIPSSIASLRKVAGSAPEYQFQSNTFQDYLPPQFAGDVDSSLQVVAADNIPKKNVVIYAAFDEIQSNALGSPSGSTTRSVLVLGYLDGFQIWDVTNPENIFELISIKDAEKLGEVMFIKVITHNIHKASLYEKSFPLIALVCKPTKAHHEHDALREGLFKPKSVLNFLSLRSHKVVKTIEFENEGVITSIKCNDRAIVVALSNPSRLHILSTLTLEKSFSSPLTDVASHPITRAPIYSLGPRLLAYATTSSTPKSGGKKNGAYMLGEVDEDIGGTGRYQEVAKDVARGVAKEVVNGVKLIGDYSYQTISAYFSNGAMTTSASSAPATTMPINIQSGGMSPASRGSLSPQPSPSNGYYYTTRAGGIVTSSDSNSNGGLSTAANGVDDVIGAIMIRDIGVQALSVVAHFQPHTHPVGYLSFNPSGTFLFSTSTQGHQFHIFEILGKRRRGGSHNSIKHIYGLSRGYTDASVGEGSVGWSEDSRWCAVATGRGTIHVFAINPYGGPAHIPSHIQGWVANAEEPVMLSNQSPVVRIKPRTPLPPDPTDPTNFPPQASNINDHYNYVPFDSNPPSAATSPVRRPGPLTTNGNINNINVQQIIYNGAQPIPFHQAFSFLRKPPSICLKFLSAANGLLSSNSLGGNLKRNAKRRSSPSAAVSSNIPLAGQGRRRTQSWTQSSIPGITHGAYLDFNEEEDKPDRIGYQDVLSFHPSGILTLHRIWTEGVLGEEASQGKDEGASTIGIAGVPLTRSATTVANMGKVLVDGAVGVVGIGMGMAGAGKKETVRPGEPTLDMRVSYEDVAEWNVLRDQDWAEVKRVIEPPMLCKDGNTASKRDGSKNWLAHAEIATHTTSRTSLPPPLWLVQQFTFKTYHSCYNGALHKGEIPQTKKVEIKRKKLGEEGLGKGLEDISENISNAMASYLNIPYSSNISITGNVLNGYGSFGELAETTPLSFEDAFHIQATDYQSHNIPVITTTSSSSPSASPVIPDLINLVTPSPTSSPQFVSKPSPMSLSNVQTLSNPTAPSLQRPNTFSRSASLSSVKTTTSTAAFSDDMEFISKEFSTDEAENGQESFIFDSDNDNTVSSDNGSRSEVIEEKEVLTYG